MLQLPSARVHLSSVVPTGSMQAPPHSDHRRVNDKRAHKRSVGWRDYVGIARRCSSASQTRREREDDVARQWPSHRPPGPPHRASRRPPHGLPPPLARVRGYRTSIRLSRGRPSMRCSTDPRRATPSNSSTHPGFRGRPPTHAGFHQRHLDLRFLILGNRDATHPYRARVCVDTRHVTVRNSKIFHTARSTTKRRDRLPRPCLIMESAASI